MISPEHGLKGSAKLAEISSITSLRDQRTHHRGNSRDGSRPGTHGMLLSALCAHGLGELLRTVGAARLGLEGVEPLLAL